MDLKYSHRVSQSKAKSRQSLLTLMLIQICTCLYYTGLQLRENVTQMSLIG